MAIWSGCTANYQSLKPANVSSPAWTCAVENAKLNDLSFSREIQRPHTWGNPEMSVSSAMITFSFVFQRADLEELIDTE